MAVAWPPPLCPRLPEWADVRSADVRERGEGGRPTEVAFEVDVKSPVADAVFEVDLSTLDGTYVTTNLSVDKEAPAVMLQPGRHRICLDLDVVLLPNHYTIDLGVHHTGAPCAIECTAHWT